jgi:hypothetical protein
MAEFNFHKIEEKFISIFEQFIRKSCDESRIRESEKNSKKKLEDMDNNELLSCFTFNYEHIARKLNWYDARMERSINIYRSIAYLLIDSRNAINHRIVRKGIKNDILEKSIIYNALLFINAIRKSFTENNEIKKIDEFEEYLKDILSGYDSSDTEKELRERLNQREKELVEMKNSKNELQEKLSQREKELAEAKDTINELHGKLEHPTGGSTKGKEDKIENEIKKGQEWTPPPGGELIQGVIIDNKRLYEIFRCSRMGGMRRSKTTNTLLLIENRINSIYVDKWVGSILHYTGMGTEGDQDLNSKQNKTLKESDKNGVRILLFEVERPKEYTFLGRAELAGEPYYDDEKQKDQNGELRRVCKFPLKIVEEKYKY